MSSFKTAGAWENNFINIKNSAKKNNSRSTIHNDTEYTKLKYIHHIYSEVLILLTLLLCDF